jgi:hypothetical protein
MSDVATLALLFLFIGSTEIIGSTENRGSKATGELAVTALVTSSVSITLSPDGRLSIIVANAPADEASLIAAAAQSRPALHNRYAEHRLDNPQEERRQPFAISK